MPTLRYCQGTDQEGLARTMETTIERSSYKIHIRSDTISPILPTHRQESKIKARV
jgi:hypothetical protein